MDFDNIGPIFFFIVYLAISAWSKQKKAQKQAGKKRPEPKRPVRTEPRAPEAAPVQGVGGILEQLRKELFEIDESPLAFQQAAPMPPPPIEEDDEDEEDVVEDPNTFQEGSRSLEMERRKKVTMEENTRSEGQSLEEVLAPYSRLEQGIILQEILGKPRSRQETDAWFHRS